MRRFAYVPSHGTVPMPGLTQRPSVFRPLDKRRLHYSESSKPGRIFTGRVPVPRDCINFSNKSESYKSAAAAAAAGTLSMEVSRAAHREVINFGSHETIGASSKSFPRASAAD